jgi:TatD DNase family protein
MPLVDTHAHLTFQDFDRDRAEVIERARSSGLVAIITVGIEPQEWDAAQSLAEQFEPVHVALGVHPNSAHLASDDAMAELATRCRRWRSGRPDNPDVGGTGSGKRIVALGETGLDYYWHKVPHEVQKQAFRAHLELARQLDLPVIVHNRDAHADVLDILKRDGAGTRGVMHSFSGDPDFAMQCIRLGYAISLAGPVTFRRAVDKHRIAITTPLEWLVVETDCPFLTPEPYRGRRNEPAYVAYTAKAIASLRGLPHEQVAQATTSNACRLFGPDLIGDRADRSFGSDRGDGK